MGRLAPPPGHREEPRQNLGDPGMRRGRGRGRGRGARRPGRERGSAARALVRGSGAAEAGRPGASRRSRGGGGTGGPRGSRRGGGRRGPAEIWRAGPSRGRVSSLPALVPAVGQAGFRPCPDEWAQRQRWGRPKQFPDAGPVSRLLGAAASALFASATVSACLCGHLGAEGAPERRKSGHSEKGALALAKPLPRGLRWAPGELRDEPRQTHLLAVPDACWWLRLGNLWRRWTSPPSTKLGRWPPPLCSPGLMSLPVGLSLLVGKSSFWKSRAFPYPIRLDCPTSPPQGVQTLALA
ncbi:uncharacterized protein LOC124518033 [Lynx rufus]|uniref:uncharacterized protein LOC124518033 n=1 Tax=Lynx rufus TaxID=61384 RepID=UPI001F125B60|nr:uncharacterized protein LOC124518033 [Lynx rufus]